VAKPQGGRIHPITIFKMNCAKCARL
jgi:hypothetical protein